MRIEGGGFGFQIGASDTDIVMLVMSKKGMDGILSSKFTLGGEASVAAGPVGRDASRANGRDYACGYPFLVAFKRHLRRHFASGSHDFGPMKMPTRPSTDTRSIAEVFSPGRLLIQFHPIHLLDELAEYGGSSRG